MKPAFSPLRISFLAAMGLSLGACGGKVLVDGAEAGAAGSGSGGGATTGPGSASSSSAGGGALCAGATPVAAANGAPSGFERCPDGTIHRVAPAACDPSVGVVACTGTEKALNCKSDADCTQSPHGRCDAQANPDTGTSCACVYPCAGDGECQAGQVCVCAGVVPTSVPWASCTPASCASGEGCPSGECGISSFLDGCAYDVRLACRSGSDACRLDADCASQMGTKCALSSAAPDPSAWRCAMPKKWFP